MTKIQGSAYTINFVEITWRNLRSVHYLSAPLQKLWVVFENFDPKKGGLRKKSLEKGGAIENFNASVEV